MMIDGECRMAFLRDQATDVEFGTAPLPVADAKPDRYGGRIRDRQHHRRLEDRQEPRGGLGADHAT